MKFPSALFVIPCVVRAAVTGVSLPRSEAEETPGLQTLEQNLRRVESVREIKDLQKSFAQLAQVGSFDKVAGLFADSGVLQWGQGDTLDAKKAAVKTGPAEIESWLKADAGRMDGKQSGSLHLQINEMPLVSLSADGTSAKGRWHSLRFLGDGQGGTRIEGGEFENQYALVKTQDGEERWRISLLRYYPMFAGDYSAGWRSVSSRLPIVPYHFTPDQAGMPILQNQTGGSAESKSTIKQLEYRIAQLHAEDDVRNLQHSYGYYVDQRMWTDVLDLFSPDGKFNLDNSTYSGPKEIRGALESWMGSEGMAKGILNERPNFHTMVSIAPDGRRASTRGLEFGLVGDANKHTAKWEFGIFHNDFVRDENSGLWKLQNLNITRVMVADYAEGWGRGGRQSTRSEKDFPAILDRSWRFSSAEVPQGWQTTFPPSANLTAEQNVADLARRLSRSAAFDETENVSSAYGYFADDIRCTMFANLHAQKGFKESPGTGWYVTPERIAKACTSRYGAREDPGILRPNVPFHWRPQPVILVSQDGRSSSLRSRILQLGTSGDSTGGFSGVWGFNGGMYHDQFVLEQQADGTTRRKLWSLSLDEFYWQSQNWSSGWAGVSRTTKTSREIAPVEMAKLYRRQQQDFPPDVSLKDPTMAEREKGLSGGSGTRVAWPDWAPMWWAYRNPVSGRVPKYYWGPGCVPCRTAKPEWALTKNGYEEPPSGPTLLEATVSGGIVSIKVTAGPEEPATGMVEIHDADGTVLQTASVDEHGVASVKLPEADSRSSGLELTVIYTGSNRLRPAKATVVPK